MLLKQGHLCKLVKSAIRKMCAVRKATTPKVKLQESAEFKFEKLFDKKEENRDEPNTIECANFHMSGFNPSMKELMEGLVYSPSGRYAVNFQKSLGKIKGIFILDTNSMKFHMYESGDPENDLFLKMDIFYWFGEDCLVFIRGDCRAKKFYQTPVVLNHGNKTFQVKETGSYNFAPPGSEKRKFPRMPVEAKTLLLSGERYVMWFSKRLDGEYLNSVYAIPERPYSNLKLKRFLLKIDDSFIMREMSGLVDKLQTDPMLTGSLISHHDLHIITVDSIAYFPCNRYDYVEERDRQILGLYLAIDFEKLVDVYDFWPNGYDGMFSFWETQRNFWETQREAITILEVVPNDTTPFNPEKYLKTPGIHRKLGKLFLSLIKERTSDGKNATTLYYFDFESQTTQKVHEEIDLCQGDDAICLTPFNIVYGHQISETKIRCRTVPLPTGNQLLSLKESAMRRTYLNKKW